MRLVQNLIVLARNPSTLFKIKLRTARHSFEPFITLKVLAEKVKRPEHTVKYWQYTGNIPSEALGDLCDALNVDMEYWRV